MNDDRKYTTLNGVTIEVFPVDDEGAMRREVDALSNGIDWGMQDRSTRQAISSLVREALLRMADNVDDWMPEAFVAKSQTSYGIFVWWQNHHLDEEIVRQRHQVQCESEARLADLQRLARRTGGDGSSG